ncbi:hypothetical protein MHU86_17922 [Fragilaria crotonensis]|nr:hypothetical protein MHU86_17922 [Fragilaria crotonensis]
MARSFLVRTSSFKFDFQGTVDYFEKLELRQALEAKRRKVDKTDNPEGTKKGNWIGKSADKMATAKTQSSKYKKCAHCGRTNHTTKDCWFNPENKGKQKSGKKNVGSTDRNVLMTQEQLNAILERLPRNPKWHVRRSGKDGQSPSDRRTRDTDRRTPRHNTTQDTNCSQSERTRIDKDTTLVNLASPPTRLEPQTQWRGQTTLAHR